MADLTNAWVAKRLDAVIVELEMENALEPAQRRVLADAVEGLADSVSMRIHNELVKRTIDEGLAHMDEQDRKHREEMGVLESANTSLKSRSDYLGDRYMKATREAADAQRQVAQYKNIAREADRAMKEAQRELAKRIRQDRANALRPWTD